MKRVKGIVERVTNPNITFEKRTVSLVSFFAEIAIIVSLIGDFIIEENIVEIVVLLLFTIINPMVIHYAFKHDRVSIAPKFQTIALTFVALPISFFFGGGPLGGGIFWVAFVYMYIGVVLTGRFRIFMAISLTGTVLGEYIAWFINPDIVTFHSHRDFAVDSIVSLLLVGIIIALSIHFEKLMFKRENLRAKEAVKIAEELNISQNLFFSRMSHEIRTPINSILGLNEIILRDENATEEIKQDATNIQGAGKMLLALVNDILDISKIEAGKMDIVPVNYSLGAMVSEIINMIGLIAEQKGLKFEVDIDPSIPSELYGDEVRIEQILVNLLNNAVKYTKEGSVSLYMECEQIEDNRALLNFTVSDTGIGIKQDALPHLFEVFQRVDQEKNRMIEGSGLGLSIVKQLVDLMGGNISVNSVYSQGSTFAVSLWQEIANATPIGEINIASADRYKYTEKYKSEFTAPEARILIVDDNEMNLEVEKRLLVDTGMTIDTVISGKHALEATLKHSYDAIFMDHLMPDMDGPETLHRIRKQVGGLNTETPVVVLTANAGGDNLKLYRHSGFDGYLLKPVSGAQLEEMLLKQIPESKITRNKGNEMTHEDTATTRGYNKKVPIVIATSSMCDLPQSIIKEMHIEMIPFLIHNDAGTFYDNIEAECDELVYYMNNSKGRLDSEPPTVADFEEFFANMLKKSHKVIYIALTTSMSKDYERALQASNAFENVTVVNSECLSSSMGFMVMVAKHMVRQGESVEKIVERLEYIKTKIHCSFIIDSTDFMIKRGFISGTTYRLMKTLHMRPSLKIKNDSFGVERIWLGTTRNCYEKYINHTLPKTANPELDIIFITYVDMSEETLEWIKSKVQKRFAFKHIVLQKASAAISLNCGPGAFGLLYMDSGTHTYNFGVQLAKGNDLLDIDEDEESVENSTITDENASILEPLMQDELTDQRQDEIETESGAFAIAGIDMKTALKNSGSEEAFKTVLNIFYEAIDGKYADFKRYYESKDTENFAIKIHALKSSARLIGALELGNKAEAMEMAAKEDNLAYIEEHFEEVMSDYLKYKELLKPYCEKDEQQSTKPEADMDLMQNVYEALKTGAEAMDCSMIEDTFAEIEEYSIPASETDKYKQLKEKFDAFDYEGMIGLL